MVYRYIKASQIVFVVVLFYYSVCDKSRLLGSVTRAWVLSLGFKTMHSFIYLFICLLILRLRLLLPVNPVSPDVILCG